MITTLTTPEQQTNFRNSTDKLFLLTHVGGPREGGVDVVDKSYIDAVSRLSQMDYRLIFRLEPGESHTVDFAEFAETYTRLADSHDLAEGRK